MNKIQSIQRSKLVTSYGGVGSIIDTIDNLAYMIEPFDQWNFYTQRMRQRGGNPFDPFKVEDERLKTRLRNHGFDNLQMFFLPDENFENVSPSNPDNQEINRMVTAKYSPQWFYCKNEKCHKLNHIDIWKQLWTGRTGNDMKEPKCSHCCTGNQRFIAPRLQQVRFVLASLENGELRDIPWDRLWSAKNGRRNFTGQRGEVKRVWDFRENIELKDITFHTKKGGSDLSDIYIKSNDTIMTMAEVMTHYFILDDGHVYQPVIRSANNVYFAYNMSSVYIPRHLISNEKLEDILEEIDEGKNAEQIHSKRNFRHIPVQDIQYIIDKRVAPNPDYTTEDRFRMDEFDQITNEANYIDGQYNPNNRLDIWKYNWSNDNSKPMFVKNIYLLKHLEVTTVQVAYSRLERVSVPNFTTMTGSTTKQWFNINEGVFTNREQTTKVGLHPTCSGDRSKIKYMPASISCGEGFFVELDLNTVNKIENKNKKIFTHTFAHLIMKELEFSCGYPLASMNERLYILPTEVTEATEDKFGFLIYSANGEAGSYGGITSLFDNNIIERILINAIDLANDCPSDPICESHEASCFACVQIPETACELFNKELSRKVFNEQLKLFGENEHNQPIEENIKETTKIEEVTSKTTTDTKISRGVILG